MVPNSSFPFLRKELQNVTQKFARLVNLSTKKQVRGIQNSEMMLLFGTDREIITIEHHKRQDKSAKSSLERILKPIEELFQR